MTQLRAGSNADAGSDDPTLIWEKPINVDSIASIQTYLDTDETIHFCHDFLLEKLDSWFVRNLEGEEIAMFEDLNARRQVVNFYADASKQRMAYGLVVLFQLRAPARASELQSNRKDYVLPFGTVDLTQGTIWVARHCDSHSLRYRYEPALPEQKLYFRYEVVDYGAKVFDNRTNGSLEIRSHLGEAFYKRTRALEAYTYSSDANFESAHPTTYVVSDPVSRGGGTIPGGGEFGASYNSTGKVAADVESYNWALLQNIDYMQKMVEQTEWRPYASEAINSRMRLKSDDRKIDAVNGLFPLYGFSRTMPAPKPSLLLNPEEVAKEYVQHVCQIYKIPVQLFRTDMLSSSKSGTQNASLVEAILRSTIVENRNFVRTLFEHSFEEAYGRKLTLDYRSPPSLLTQEFLQLVVQHRQLQLIDDRQVTDAYDLFYGVNPNSCKKRKRTPEIEDDDPEESIGRK